MCVCVCMCGRWHGILSVSREVVCELSENKQFIPQAPIMLSALVMSWRMCLLFIGQSDGTACMH